MQVKNSEIGLSRLDQVDGGRAVRNLAQDPHAIGGTQGCNPLPDDVVIVRQYYGKDLAFLHDASDGSLSLCRGNCDRNYQCSPIWATFNSHSAAQILSLFSNRPKSDSDAYVEGSP